MRNGWVNFVSNQQTTDQNTEGNSLTSERTELSSPARLSLLELPRHGFETGPRSPRSCLKQKKHLESISEQQKTEEDITKSDNPISIPIEPQPIKDRAMSYQKINSRRPKTAQESVYMFLEHPAGWAGFIYHMSV